MTMTNVLIAGLVGCVAVACGDSDSERDGARPDAGMTSSTDAGGGLGDVDAGSTVDGQLRLRINSVTPGGAIPAGRLVVVWSQFDDTAPEPEIELGLDVPFDPGVGSIALMLSEISLPGPENLWCERACADESQCPCLGSPQVGIGLVATVIDGNNNGVVDVPGELGVDNVDGVYGIGVVVVGSSSTGFAVAPAPFDALFVAGIEAGVVPYSVVPQPGGQALEVPDGPVEFELDVCVPEDASCADLRVPDLG